jgi:hypothetical protein
MNGAAAFNRMFNVVCIPMLCSPSCCLIPSSSPRHPSIHPSLRVFVVKVQLHVQMTHVAMHEWQLVWAKSVSKSRPHTHLRFPDALGSTRIICGFRIRLVAPGSHNFSSHDLKRSLQHLIVFSQPPCWNQTSHDQCGHNWRRGRQHVWQGTLEVATEQSAIPIVANEMKKWTYGS